MKDMIWVSYRLFIWSGMEPLITVTVELRTATGQVCQTWEIRYEDKQSYYQWRAGMLARHNSWSAWSMRLTLLHCSRSNEYRWRSILKKIIRIFESVERSLWTTHQDVGFQPILMVFQYTYYSPERRLRRPRKSTSMNFRRIQWKARKLMGKSAFKVSQGPEGQGWVL